LRRQTSTYPSQRVDMSTNGGSDDSEYMEEGSEYDYEYESGNESQSAKRKQPEGEVNPRKQGKFSLPSRDEQLMLQNTDTLLKTNLLRMQADELLAEVRTSSELEKKKLSSWLDEVLVLLRECRGLSGVEVTPTWLSEKAGVSFDDDSNEAVSIIFEPPSTVEIIGSFAFKAITAPILNIDIAVHMPSSCFNTNDILNHAYFSKRKLYLGALWKLLAKHKGASLSLALFKGDVRKPIIQLKPTSFKSKVTIRIIPVAPNTVFKLSQLRGDKNNVRPEEWMTALNESKKTKSKAVLDASTLQGTPFYNHSILEDVAISTQFKVLSQALSACPVARDGLILFKVWLAQRSMRFYLESIDSHYAALVVAYLVQVKRITAQMLPLAALQVIFRFFAETNFGDSEFSFLSMKPTDRDDSRAIPFVLTHPLSDQSNLGKPTVCTYSSMWRVRHSALDDLVHEARRSLRLLESSSNGAFDSLFLSKASFFDRHDMFFHMNLSDANFRGTTLRKGDSASTNDDILQERLRDLKTALCDQTTTEYFSQQVCDIVTEALGTRVIAARVLVSCADKFAVEKAVMSPAWDEPNLTYKGTWVISIGLVLQKDTSYRKVDRGPSAEMTSECERFRKFWGSKSKLRRFQDGSIIEAVVWDESKQRAAALKAGAVPRGERIVEEIVRYVLARHFPFRGCENVQCKGALLEQYFLPAPGIIKDETSLDSSSSHDSETMSRKAIECLDALRGILISKMKDLPLAIESVSAVCPELRYTSLVPPLQCPFLDKDLLKQQWGNELSLLAMPLQVIARVESGGKWPTNGEAINSVKTALYLRLGELLAAQFQLNSVPHRDCIDIFNGGFVFRLVFIASPEVERHVTPDKRLVYQRGTIAALHHNSIKAVQGKFPSFGNTVRLLTRWSMGNYLTGHIKQEAWELLAASVYLECGEAEAPSCPSAGFRRALRKLCSNDWENTPVVVDFTGDLSLEDRVKISSRFKSVREKGAGPSLYLVSSLEKAVDFEPSFCDETSPSRVVLRLVVAAAEKALAALDLWVREDERESRVTNLMDTSMIQTLASATLRFAKPVVSSHRLKSGIELWDSVQKGPPFARLKVFSNMSGKETSYSNLIVRPGSTPCPIQEEIVGKLRRDFGDVAVFFWNGLSGQDILVVWKPAAFLPSKFGILQAANKVVLESSAILNTAQIVTKMIALGEGALDAKSVVLH